MVGRAPPKSPSCRPVGTVTGGDFAFTRKQRLPENICMKRFPNTIFICAVCFSVVRTVAGQTVGEMHAFVQDSRTKHELLLDLRDGAEAADTNGVTWRLSVESTAVAGQPDARDYRLIWTVTMGQVESASVGVVFEFKDWSPENFVLVPAAVYDGNRFDIKRISYPP